MYSVSLHLSSAVESVVLVVVCEDGHFACKWEGKNGGNQVVEQKLGTVVHMEVYFYRCQAPVPCTAIESARVVYYQDEENLVYSFSHAGKLAGGNAEVYSVSLSPSNVTRTAPTYDLAL